MEGVMVVPLITTFDDFSNWIKQEVFAPKKQQLPTYSSAISTCTNSVHLPQPRPDQAPS